MPTTSCSRSSGSGRRINPYFKVTSSNHSYFSDMGMPKLLKSVEKVDDYTVKITLNQPEAPFLADLAMEFAAIQSKEYADAMLKAGTPEKIDQEPIGTGPFYLRAVPEGRGDPLQGVPRLLGRQGQDRRSGLSRSRRTHRCAGPSCRRANAT